MRIALVEWNWMGHHPTYFNFYLLALEELGVDVLAVCPEPDEAAATAGKTRASAGGDQPRRGRTEFVKITIPKSRFERVRPQRISNIDLAIRRFTSFEGQVLEWSRKNGSPVDAIFYTCIYDFDFQWMRWVRPFLKLPWLGLYLHALSFRKPGSLNPVTGRLPAPEKIFSDHRCKGIGILDEEIVGRVARAIGKPVVALPDITDERLAVNAADRALSDKMKRFAAGRPIVTLFGYLKRSKGILTFLEAARLPGAANICFAVAGEVHWGSLEDQAGEVRRALAELPNVWSHLERISDGPCFNDLLAAGNVIFAAYHDFPHSSGIQTKAAILQRPLIVSDGYLMAERTRRYHIGEVIPEGNAPALLAAIHKITKDPAAWAAQNQPRWNDYYQLHSFARLKNGLQQLLAGL